MSTPITDITGIGPATADILSEQGYKSAEDLAATNVKTLCAVPGFGPIKAKSTIAAAKKIAGKPAKKKKAASKPKSKTKSDKKKKDAKSSKPKKKDKKKSGKKGKVKSKPKKKPGKKKKK